MKVTVSCAGRFHAYDLADQLNRHHILLRLITTYPKSEIRKFSLPNEKITSLLYWELLNRGWEAFSRWTGMERSYLQAAINEAYDLMAPSFIPSDTEIYIGWSSNAERGLKRAKALSAFTILERGSAHIQMQTRLLMEEHQKFNLTKSPSFTPAQVIEKELREYALADRISVPSSFVRRSFIEQGIPPDKIFQNPYGVDLQQFGPGEKTDDVFRIIYVGQMSLRKGVHYLLKACHSLSLPNSELVLIGSKTPEIEPYFELYKESFTYLGTMRQDELRRHYNRASVFVICSIEEGMAMVQLQAMACGLPLICTEHTGGDDLIENGKQGFVIPIRNVDALKEKITWMYEHQGEMKQMGNAARHKVEKGYTWKDYGDRYYSFLHENYAKGS